MTGLIQTTSDEPIVTNLVPKSANLYDCYIKCDSSTKILFNRLDQCDVLRLMQIVRDAIVYKDYTEPKTFKVALVVEAHEETDGES